MLTVLVLVAHVILSSVLVMFILMHRGQGGGLSEMFGGGNSGLHGSAMVERNLDRITIATSLGWFATTAILLLIL